MSKFFALFFIVSVALLGCQQETLKIADVVPTVDTKVHIVDSTWTEPSAVLSASRMSRGIDPNISLSEAMALAAEYNATHTDNQWFVYVGDVPPVEQAPDCEVWLVDKDTYKQKLDVNGDPRHYVYPREFVFGRLPDWRRECEIVGNGALYVDNPPPAEIAPPIVIPPDPYIYYAIYMLDENGAILHETHCEDWETGGWASREAEFYMISQGWEAEVQGHPGWSVVKRQLYTAP